MIDVLKKYKLNKDTWLEQLAIKIFNDIFELTKDKRGISRETYGEGETKAINYFIKLATDFGFHVEVDPAANVFFSLKPIKNSRYILTGSHMDSVPMGGNFDGLAGVVAGFLILIYIKKNRYIISQYVKMLNYIFI